MGRTVAAPRDAEFTLYFPFESEGDLFDWDLLVEGIVESLPSSYYPVDRWASSEIKVIAENGHASVAISEYCGLVALSLCVNPENKHLAHRTIEATRKALEGYDQYVKQGTFSNGNALYVIKA